MIKRRFVWNTAKATHNLAKHKVSFETATRVFSDPFARTVQDRIEDHEERWQTVGLVDGHLMIMVAHLILEDDDQGEAVEIIRIISARRAEPKERRNYENQKH